MDLWELRLTDSALVWMDRTEQRQEYERIIQGMYRRKYRELGEESRAEFLNKECRGSDNRARFRRDNEDRVRELCLKTEEKNVDCVVKGRKRQKFMEECREVGREKELTGRMSEEKSKEDV